MIRLLQPQEIIERWEEIDGYRAKAAERGSQCPKSECLRDMVLDSRAFVYEISEGDTVLGSMALVFDGCAVKDQLSVLWFVMTPNTMRDQYLDEAKQEMRYMCEGLGQSGILIPGRFGWEWIARACGAREVSKTWRLEKEQL